MLLLAILVEKLFSPLMHEAISHSRRGIVLCKHLAYTNIPKFLPKPTPGVGGI